MPPLDLFAPAIFAPPLFAPPLFAPSRLAPPRYRPIRIVDVSPIRTDLAVPYHRRRPVSVRRSSRQL